ncbi:unnamed protein product [Lathyrus sativus]|nr:unnamed protein product [Lathyrus sativus]
MDTFFRDISCKFLKIFSINSRRILLTNSFRPRDDARLILPGLTVTTLREIVKFSYCRSFCGEPLVKHNHFKALLLGTTRLLTILVVTSAGRSFVDAVKN